MGTVVAGTVSVVVLFVVSSCDLPGDNTDKNRGRYSILRKSKI